MKPGKARLICFYGLLSMNNKLPVAVIGHLVEVCHIHSAIKQFFGIGKVYAISALHDELRHQQMSKITKFGAIFAPNYINAANDSDEQKVNSNELSKLT